MNGKDLGPCTSCLGLEARVLFSTKTPFSEFQLVQCMKCELTRVFPFPDDQSLRIHDIPSYYGRDADKFNPLVQKIRAFMALGRARNYLKLIPKSVGTPKILDVGCANGRLLDAFLEYGCECWGVEHPSYPAHRFMNVDRIRYFQGDLGTINLPQEAFDLIFLWHVLEHMDDPQLTMNRLHGLLAPKGAVIMAMPNFSSLEAQRFKQFWFHLDIPWHKYHFNERSLRYLAKKTNYRTIRMTTGCLEQGPYGLFQSVLNAMGWRQNEFYEALKGSLKKGRIILLTIQFIIGLFLLIPSFFLSVLAAMRGKGPILKVILKKGKG